MDYDDAVLSLLEDVRHGGTCSWSLGVEWHICTGLLWWSSSLWNQPKHGPLLRELHLPFDTKERHGEKRVKIQACTLNAGA